MPAHNVGAALCAVIAVTIAHFQVSVKCRIVFPGQGILLWKGAVRVERKQYYVALNGRRFTEKPEDWTHLDQKYLVPKDHPRIRFRGQIDLLQAKLVRTQVELTERGADPKLVGDLQSILDLLRQLLRSEVLDEPLPSEDVIGLTPQELRRQSHDPQGFFGVEYMKLPDKSMGFAYAALNELRAQVRVAETAAVCAFKDRPTQVQRQLLQTMNRLSSAVHILMCRELAGRYHHG